MTITNCVRCNVLLKRPEEKIVCSICLWSEQSVSISSLLKGGE
jgi:hypothetical protein